MRPLYVWEKNYCPSDDPDLIEKIFKKRHRIALIAMISCTIGNMAIIYFFLEMLDLSKEWYESHYLFLLNIAILVFSVFYVLFRYRCPRCNAVPKSNQIGASGVLLFPKKCANCEAPLMPDHPWAQE